jgi:hypothetical protein
MHIKRKINRNRNKSLRRIALIILYIGVIILISAGSFFLYPILFPKPLFVSPLSNTFTLNSVSQSDAGIGSFKALLKEKRVDFTKIITSESSYTVNLKEGSEVIFSKQKDLQLQFSSLQFILSRLTMEGKQFSRLDLRFDKPVIILRK